MRNHELSEGIEVTTKDGESLGNSKAAAKKVRDCIFHCFIDDCMCSPVHNLVCFIIEFVHVTDVL